METRLIIPRVGVGVQWACEAKEKNNWKLCLEMASSWVLTTGMCLSVIVKFPLVAVKNRRQSRLMMYGWHDVFPSHAWTMGRLSQKNQMDHW